MICMIIRSLQRIGLSNIHEHKKRERKNQSVCPHVSKPNLICQKRESFFCSCIFSFLLSIFLSSLSCDQIGDYLIGLVVEKRWMVLTQLGRERNQHPSRVMDMNQCIILSREKREKTKKMNSFSESHLQLADYMCTDFLRAKKQFLF